MGKPNVVFVVPDSYRGDVLGHMGNAGAVTPCLDAIVAEGAVSYRNAFAQNPVCTPSRCSFMTGWYVHTHGHRSMRNMLKPYEPNVMDVLRREGYFVWWGGKNDLFRVEKPEDYLTHCDVKFKPDARLATVPGFAPAPDLPQGDPRHGAYLQGVHPRNETAEGVRDCDTGWVRGAVEFLEQRTDEQPFFLYLPLHSPHPPYGITEDWYERIHPERLAPPIPVPQDDANLPAVLDSLRREYKGAELPDAIWREVKRTYYATCAKVDHLFGMVVDALKRTGRYDNTLIVFFSDHGDFTGDYALPEKTHSTMQDCLVRVPLVIKPPKDVPVRSGIREHLAELIDIPATVYDLLGIEPGYTHQGRSLRVSLAGTEDETRDAVFAEVGGRKDEVGFFNTDVDRMPQWSFYGRQSRAVRPHTMAGSHAVMCRTHAHKYIRRFYTGHHELFDLAADPGETRNLSGNPAYADIERRMETRLLDWFMETSDVMPHETDSRQI